MKGDKETAIKIIETRNFINGLSDTYEDAKFLGWYGWGTMRKFVKNNKYILDCYIIE